MPSIKCFSISCVIWDVYCSCTIIQVFSSRCFPLRKDVDASRDCEGEKEALLCEGSDRPITEKDSTPRLKDDEADSGDVILEHEVNKWKLLSGLSYGLRFDLVI